MPFATANLQGIMLSEVSQIESNIVCYYLYMEPKN